MTAAVTTITAPARKPRSQFPSAVVNGKKRKNGGWHHDGKDHYREALVTLNTFICTYSAPLLYHLCFQGRSNQEHKNLLKALNQKLKREGMAYEWFSARETDSDKGEHLHVFMLVSAAKVNPAAVLNTFDDGYLGKAATKRGITVHINPPQNDIHGGKKFARLPYLGPGNRAREATIAEMEDAEMWLSYIYKARGKPDSVDVKLNGQRFSSSRPTR